MLSFVSYQVSLLAKFESFTIQNLPVLFRYCVTAVIIVLVQLLLQRVLARRGVLHQDAHVHAVLCVEAADGN